MRREGACPICPWSTRIFGYGSHLDGIPPSQTHNHSGRTLGHTPTSTSEDYSKISNAACSVTISNHVVLDLTFQLLTSKTTFAVFECNFPIELVLNFSIPTGSDWNTAKVRSPINLVPQFWRLLRQLRADTASKVYCTTWAHAGDPFLHFRSPLHFFSFLTMIFYMKVFKQYTNYD